MNKIEEEIKFRLIKTLKASIDIEAFKQEFININLKHLEKEICDDEFKNAVDYFFVIDELINKGVIRKK